MGTKPRRFFFRGLIFRGIAGGGGEWRGIPGTGEQIFSPPFHPVRGIFPKNPAKNGKFSSARKNFSCTIGEETRGNAGLTDEAHSGLAIVKYTSSLIFGRGNNYFGGVF